MIFSISKLSEDLRRAGKGGWWLMASRPSPHGDDCLTVLALRPGMDEADNDWVVWTYNMAKRAFYSGDYFRGGPDPARARFEERSAE